MLRKLTPICTEKTLRDVYFLASVCRTEVSCWRLIAAARQNGSAVFCVRDSGRFVMSELAPRRIPTQPPGSNRTTVSLAPGLVRPLSPRKANRRMSSS